MAMTMVEQSQMQSEMVSVNTTRIGASRGRGGSHVIIKPISTPRYSSARPQHGTQSSHTAPTLVPTNHIRLVRLSPLPLLLHKLEDKEPLSMWIMCWSCRRLLASYNQVTPTRKSCILLPPIVAPFPNSGACEVRLFRTLRGIPCDKWLLKRRHRGK